MVSAPAISALGGPWDPGGLGRVSVTLAVLAAVAALADWVVVSDLAPRLRRAEYLTKPTVLVALTAAAATLTPRSAGLRDWFMAGLVLCLAGDVFLMLPGDRTESFGAGLGSFLVAHLLFIVGLVDLHPRLDTVAWALLVLGLVAAVPATLVLRAVAGGDPAWLVGPVALYLVALLVMAAVAWAGGAAHGRWGLDPWLMAGGLAFVVSDGLLAVNRFVRPFPRATVAVHATYHLAVGGLVLGLAATR